MTAISLTVTNRPSELRAKDLRAEGRLPGVLYGYKVENMPIECDMQKFHKTYIAAGESTVVSLDVAGKEIPVLIHQIDLDPVTGSYAHVDFFAINMNEEVTANIPLILTGVSPAVKDFAGILVHGRDSVSVTCLPKYLPHNLSLDISQMANLHDVLTIENLIVPEHVTVNDPEDTILVSVLPPRKEEVQVAPEAAPVAETTVKKEGEEKPGGKKE